MFKLRPVTMAPFRHFRRSSAAWQLEQRIKFHWLVVFFHCMTTGLRLGSRSLAAYGKHHKKLIFTPEEKTFHQWCCKKICHANIRGELQISGLVHNASKKGHVSAAKRSPSYFVRLALQENSVSIIKQLDCRSSAFHGGS